MPPRDVRAWLQDVVDACSVIGKCVAGHTLETYREDVVVRSAVERQFEIIGEAIRRILEVEAGLSLRLPESREVIAFRNFLAHGYHLVDHGEVWRIIHRDIPPLRSRVQEILAERGSV